MAGDLAAWWGALHAGDQIADPEIECGVQRQRTAVVHGLEEAGAGGAGLRGPSDHVLHEDSTDALVWNAGIDGDRADAGDGRARVKEIATHDPAVSFGDHRLETRVAEQHR